MLIRYRLILPLAIALFFAIANVVFANQVDFTCQGTNFIQALGNCPDGGAQETTIGGNVRILVKRGRNIPNRDSAGPAAGVSDPYVRFKTGEFRRETRVKSNTLSPKWDDEVDLGFLNSGTEIKVELWDSDGGLEFSDDLLARTTMRVPYCSMFYANYTEVSCGKPFGCESTDSLWAMPRRKECVEVGEISFQDGKCTSSNVCLEVEVHIVPFTMEVELEVGSQLLASPEVSAVASITTQYALNAGFSLPFIGDETTTINVNAPQVLDLKGALMFRLPNNQRAYGSAEEILFYAGMNFPATIYICRYDEDNSAIGIPNWITKEYNDRYFSINGLVLTGTQEYFGCFQKSVDGTIKNKYGGIEKGFIEFRSNTVDGLDGNSVAEQALYTYNYVALAIPEAKNKRKDKVTIDYDWRGFVTLAAQYGFVFWWFIFLINRFLRKIDYRVDRVSNYLASRVLTGKDCSVLAGMTVVQNGKTPSNAMYRSHMYHMRNSIYLIMLLPFLLLFSWGMVCTALVEPAGLGLAVAFLGIAALFLFYGIKLWSASHWRISPFTLASFFLAVVFLLIFLFSFIFADPGVVQFNWPLNFAAFGVVFGAINSVPLLLLAFKQDRSQAKHLHSVVVKMAEAVYFLKQKVVSKATLEKDLKVNKLLHALLGEMYTVNPSLPTFKFSSVLQELAHKKAPHHNLLHKQQGGEKEEEDDKEEETRNKQARKLYVISLVTLLIYLIIASVRTNYPSLAFLNCCTLILLDVVHLSISHGDTKWTPGFMIVLLIMGRLFIMGSPPSLWVLNYSACYLMYAYFLIQEIINGFLPLLSKRRAGEIAFAGAHDDDGPPNPDIAGTPYFNLGLLTFCFSTMMVITAFGDASSQLPAPHLKVLGYQGWHISAFGLGTICITVIGGLFFAAVRAYYLERHGLLRGLAKDSYLLRPNVKLPLVLALSTELSIIVGGLLVFAATGAVAVIVGAIFLPIIGVLLGHAYFVWRRNDYELVHWPRIKEVDPSGAGGAQGNPSDLEVAFNMIEDLFGGPEDQQLTVESVEEEPEDDSSPQRATLKGFKLPALKVTGSKIGDVKMPPLPLKSVLRKKRQTLGIKTKMPLVKDLRGREDAADIDKFGDNEDDVIDATDPWAQYEAEQEEEEKRQKAKKATRAVVKTQSIWDNKYLVMARLAIKNSKILQAMKNGFWKCWSSMPSCQKKVYPTIYQPSSTGQFAGEGDDIDDDDDNRNSGDLTGENKAGAEGGESRELGLVPLAGGSVKSPMSAAGTPKTPKDGSKASLIKTKSKPGMKPGTASAEADGVINTERDLEGNDDEEGGPATIAEESQTLLPVDPDSLPFDKALLGGYLNRKELAALGAWFGGLFFIMMFGVTLSLSGAGPVWMGHVIWVASIMFICTMVPVVKYFNTYTFDQSMQLLVQFDCLLHFVFCLTFFLTHLEADPGRVGSLWLLNYFLYYPVFLYILIEMYRWYDGGCVFKEIDFNRDGRLTFKEVLNYLRATPVLIAVVILFNWQLYVWVNFTVGQVATLLLILSVVAYIYLRDWSMNDFYLSPELRILGGYALNLTLLITFCVSIFSNTNPIFAASVFCFTLMFKFITKIMHRLSLMDKEAMIFFSPFVMPVYSYDAQNHDVIDEAPLVMNIFFTLVTGAIWGCLMAIFFYPIDIGIALACSFLLGVAALTALAVSHVPGQLAKSACMLTPENIVEAANAAREKFLDRKLPLNMEMNDWHGEVPVVDEDAEKERQEKTKTPLDRLKERTSLLNALDMINDVRSLKYVRVEEIHTNVNTEEVDEYELRWYQQMWVDFKTSIKQLMEMVPMSNNDGNWKRHSQGTFGFKEAASEVFIAARGPFAFFCFDGYIYRSLARLKDSVRYEKYYPKYLDNYDEHANDLRLVQLVEDLDIVGLMRRICDLDTAIEASFKEEMRCAIHFLLMLLVGADAKLQREQVLFQKFLRENRFRLASNGITPPPDVFSSTSFASINIPLVAAWLKTLSQDERDRFHLLKTTFSQEQSERDEMIDNSDYETGLKALELEKQRKDRDRYWIDKLSVDIMKRKEQRVIEFAESLQGFERTKFMQRRELWTTDHECYVDLKETDLYERFRDECLADRNEQVEIVQNTLLEIEAAQKDARLGEYGRAYQFVDSEFLPGEMSIGMGECAQDVLGWRCAPGISEEVMLFDGGTHPDEVDEGVFRDTWLLSAINMIVAAGEFGNGIINQQIKSLFVGHLSSDGESTLHTDVGAFCVQLFRNSEWTPIIIDDLLPMRKKEFWTNENRGMACAHNKECRGLWVSLIEKAVAKYYGSYSDLQTGYVHQALHDLTGCEALSVPLSAASRGIGKRALWDSIIRYRKNGYILGAGTGAANLADKEIQDMGIVFESAYTIYDVRLVDGHRLIKLRNPPGDHEEWKGDWSDKSPLWSRRLKGKLGHTDADDNTFFMSFDDFVNVFRSLFVCKYYNPSKWIEVVHPGVWKKSDEATIERMEMMAQFMMDQQDPDEAAAAQAKAEAEKADMDRKKARARLDSAGGLPTRHNPGCILENNPHYSFTVYRPTDIRIAVTQFHHKGRAHLDVQPFSILLCKNDDNISAKRLTKLTREDVIQSTGEPQYERTLNLYGSNIQPGLYVVLIAAYMSGMEGHFQVSLLSNYPCEFHPIWPPTWMLKGERGAPAVAADAQIKGKETSRERMVRLGGSRSNQAKQGVEKAGTMFKAGLGALFGTDTAADGNNSDEEKDSDDDDEDGSP